VAAVLVLVLVVFKGEKGTEGAGEDISGPARVVADFYESMEKKDVDMLLGTMEPRFREELESVLGRDYRDLMSRYFMKGIPSDLRVEIREIDTRVKGDWAEVTVVEGTMSYTAENGETVREEASEADIPIFELIRQEGKWYISYSCLEELGFDLRSLKGLLEGGTEGGESGDQESGDLAGEVELPVDSEDEVITVLLLDEEIREWYMNAENPGYEIFDNGDHYLVHLFDSSEESGAGESVPFGDYAVEKESGQVYKVVY